MWLGPVVLGVLTLALGILPSLAANTVFAPTASAMAGQSIKVSLSLWSGFTPVLALSLVTIAAGVLGYLLYGRLLPIAVGWTAAVSRIGPARWYEASLYIVLLLAKDQSRRLQSGYLRHYIHLVLFTFLILVGGTLILIGIIDWPDSFTTPYIHEVGLAGLILAATLMAITTPFTVGRYCLPGCHWLQHCYVLRPIQRPRSGNDPVCHRNADGHPFCLGFIPTALFQTADYQTHQATGCFNCSGCRGINDDIGFNCDSLAD